MRFVQILLIMIVVAACQNSDRSTESVDWQGHRGARGEMPENTIPGFIHALDAGVTTLEMDVVISGDRKVIVSHEPFMSSVICLDDNNEEISEEQSRDLNVYQMSYEEIAQYNCGSRPHPNFPDQQKVKLSKPLFADVVNSCESHADVSQIALPRYNIEIKSRPEWDGEYHPSPAEFAELLMNEVTAAGIDERVTIQSFDPRPLKYIHKESPSIPLMLLVEDKRPLDEQLDELGFVPHSYGCQYDLLDDDLVDKAHKKGMKVVAWTVNKQSEIDDLLQMGVDGIITDYPSKFVKAEADH